MMPPTRTEPRTTAAPGALRALACTLRRMVAAALAGSLLLVAAPVAAQDSWRDRFSAFGNGTLDVVAVPFDLLVVRPLAACATVIGAALFVPALAMGAANDRETLEEGFEIFVGLPAKNVYERPLGEL